MYFGKLLNEIRNEKGDSLTHFWEKLGVSHSYLVIALPMHQSK